MNSVSASPVASRETSPKVSSEVSSEVSPVASLQPAGCGEASSASQLLTCRACGRQLPAESFELYPTGTRRRVCRQCKYQLYGKAAKIRWRYKQLSMACYGKAARFPHAFSRTPRSA